MWGHHGGVVAAQRLSRRASILIAALVSVVSMLACAAAAHATTDPGYSWQSGPLVESQDSNCITGATEQEAGVYMSYYFDPDKPPQTGKTYYVAVNVAGIGNTCAGIYADVELKLPTGTTLAITPSTPVECFLQFPGASSYTRDTGDCPSSLVTGALGAPNISLDPLSNPPFWPLPNGGTVEVNIPVTSADAGANLISGTVELADGESDPKLTTYVDAIVDTPTQVTDNAAASVSYASPEITNETFSSLTGVGLDATGYVWNQGVTGGSAVAEITYPSAPGTAPSTNCDNPDISLPTSTGYVYMTNVVGLQSPDTEITGAAPGYQTFTGLDPGTPYCWRIWADIGPGTVYEGNWQFLVTTGTPLATGPYALKTTPAVGISGCSASAGGCTSSSCSVNGSTCTACTTNCLTTFSPPKPTPQPAPTPAPAPSPTAPTVTSAAQSHDKWKDGNALAVISKHHKAKGPPVGTTFTFSLNESAAITMTFTDQVKGRTVGGKCVAATHANKHKPSCSLTRTAGTLSFTGHSGTNTVVFDGRVSATDKLKPGSYTVAIGATSSSLTATPSSLSFTIAK